MLILNFILTQALWLLCDRHLLDWSGAITSTISPGRSTNHKACSSGPAQELREVPRRCTEEGEPQIAWDAETASRDSWPALSLMDACKERASIPEKNRKCQSGGRKSACKSQWVECGVYGFWWGKDWKARGLHYKRQAKPQDIANGRREHKDLNRRKQGLNFRKISPLTMFSFFPFWERRQKC